MISYECNDGVDYGGCTRCGVSLVPKWFRERNNTGFVRVSCSHLECPSCKRTFSADDSLHKEWSHE